MSASAPVAKYLKDYRPAPFLIDRVDLEFDILDSHTSVRARMVVKRNPKADASDTLQLDGSAELVAVRLDGEALAPSAWSDARGLAMAARHWRALPQVAQARAQRRLAA